MPATDYYMGSTGGAFSSLGRSVMSIRRDQIHSMESSKQEMEVDAFQRQVAGRFHELSAVGSDDLLSLSWITKLLDVFMCCQEEFRMIMFNHKGFMNRAPMDRLISEYYERSVKALDVCNAIRDGIEQIRQWNRQLEIVLSALDSRRGGSSSSIGEAQIRRAKKTLIDLTIGMLDEKDHTTAAAAAAAALGSRNRSFGRNNNLQQKDHKQLSDFRSLSWSVSRSWSAARQLLALGNNLAAPRTNEIVGSGGLAVAVHIMSYVLLFVMWALVAAIPCQDRGIQVNFNNIPRQSFWGGPILSLHDRIVEESRRRERRNSCGLLREIERIEKCGRWMNEWTESVEFPLTKHKEIEMRERAEEMGIVFGEVRDGLGPLELQIKQVFHIIVRSRTEGLDSVVRGNNNSDQ